MPSRKKLEIFCPHSKKTVPAPLKDVYYIKVIYYLT